MVNTTKTAMMMKAEKRLGRPLEEVIPEAYLRCGTLESAGKELGIKANTLYVWMLRLGLTRRVVLVQRDSR